MLAHPLTQRRLDALGPKFFVQPKLRGERCRVSWFHGDPVLLSSYGNVFHYLGHIEKALQDISDELGEIPFDGELYVHGWSQEEINSACNRLVNKSSFSTEMEYHIFDLQEKDVTQVERLAFLKAFDNRGLIKPPLRLVETGITDQDHVLNVAADFVDRGYEGIICRHVQGLYEMKRSASLVKYKPTETDTYQIVEIIEAISQEGEPKNMVGAFYVSAHDDFEPFKVGAGKLTHKEREKIWRQRHAYIGKNLVVKHETIKTANQIPLCCVAVEVEE
jgi:ATP-dependent DNA ligase